MALTLSGKTGFLVGLAAVLADEEDLTSSSSSSASASKIRCLISHAEGLQGNAACNAKMYIAH